MLSALLVELAAEWELGAPFPQDMPGVYTIPLDEGVSCTVSSFGQNGILFMSSIAAVPKARQEEFFTHALLANLFGQGTKGALLGLNENGTVLTLSRTIDYDIGYKEFRDLVEDFISTIDFWREESLKFA